MLNLTEHRREQGNANKLAENFKTCGKRLNNLPVVASRYQIILRGKEAFYEFMNWGIVTGALASNGLSLVTGKVAGVNNGFVGKRPESMWLAEFRKRHYWRRAERNMPEPMSDEEWKTLLDLATEKICS